MLAGHLLAGSVEEGITERRRELGWDGDTARIHAGEKGGVKR
jgi:hypothetical protein